MHTTSALLATLHPTSQASQVNECGLQNLVDEWLNAPCGNKTNQLGKHLEYIGEFVVSCCICDTSNTACGMGHGSWLCSLLFVAVISTMTKCNLERSWIVSSHRLQSSVEEGQGSDVRQKPWRTVAHWRAPSGLFG